ncbi:MAG: Gfo/Idh/MocA family oxidoreductase [Eubacteriales bacterium]|nr:Gfo/Idh/MocA family oxidoreductase [Eubacteriales bacterium]
MKEVRFGIAGLGRLGKVHAGNIANRIPGAKLVAACSIMPAELEYANNELGVAAEKLYTDFREMVKDPDIDAVAIVTTSTEHCWQIEAALDAGKHVFCDKPLGVTLEECMVAKAAVDRHPELNFMLGFMRRFDPSYAYAKEKIDAGAIGTPYMVKATGIDPEATVQGTIRFAKTSGGIFIDMAVHDIDLMRWFLGSEATEVYALGATFKHPEFREAGDDETGVAVYRFANGGIGTIHVGRTAAHGYHIETEIIGTEGSIRISPVPEKNLAVLYNQNGVVTECVDNFQTRFLDAYRREVEYFVNCLLEGRKPEITVDDGILSTKIGFATTKAWKEGGIVRID